MTPAQSHLARHAAERILRAQIHAMEGLPPRPVAIPYDEAQCLLVAAAPVLDLPADALDLGPYVAPAVAQKPALN